MQVSRQVMNHENVIVCKIDFGTEVFDLLLEFTVFIGQICLYFLKPGAQNRKQVDLHEKKEDDTDNDC